MSAEDLPLLHDECFFIAPIGSEGTVTRDRSDGVLEYIVAPAARELGLVTIRADKIAKPGQITRQVIEHVVGARAAVVDLTEANPNVYYEMAVRHTAQLPTVLIAQEGEKLPFDISQMRTIFFDHTSLKSAAECQSQITQHLREAIGGEVDSPITASVTVQRLERGTSQERVLAKLVDGVDEVRTRLRHLENRSSNLGMPSRVRRDLENAWMLLQGLRGTSEVPDLDVVIQALERPVRYLVYEGSPRNRLVARQAGERKLHALRDAEEKLQALRDADLPAEIKKEFQARVIEDTLFEEGEAVIERVNAIDERAADRAAVREREEALRARARAMEEETRTREAKKRPAR